jgi:hypothetical protein
MLLPITASLVFDVSAGYPFFSPLPSVYPSISRVLVDTPLALDALKFEGGNILPLSGVAYTACTYMETIP